MKKAEGEELECRAEEEGFDTVSEYIDDLEREVNDLKYKKDPYTEAEKDIARKKGFISEDEYRENKLKEAGFITEETELDRLERKAKQAGFKNVAAYVLDNLDKEVKKAGFDSIDEYLTHRKEQAK